MNKNSKILFFLRANCKHSDKMLKELKKYTNKITKLVSSKPNQKIPRKIFRWKGEYIFSFRSYYILPMAIINKARVAAINFHPGTPQYRGIGCTNFAILNSAKFFGSTCHKISKKIDNGKIINVERFPIRKNDNINSVLRKTYNLQVGQFKKLVFNLYKDEKNLKIMIKKSQKESWSKRKYTRKELNELYKLNNYFNNNYLQKYLRATVTKKFSPYLEFKGKKYFLGYEKR